MLSTASAPCGPGPGVGVLFGSPPRRPREGAELPPSVTSSWGGGAGLPIPNPALSPSPASLWAAASKACLERHWQSVGSQISYFKGLQMFPKSEMRSLSGVVART